jgi:integration host factor subunit alpha
MKLVVKHNSSHQGAPTMTLTKAQIVEDVSVQNGYSKKESAEAIEILLEIIKKKLASGEDVLISNFGKFCVKVKKQRLGRNPATGAPAVIASRRVVTFKCSGTLREKVNS